MDFLEETHYVTRDGRLYRLRFTDAAAPLPSAPGVWQWAFPYTLTPWAGPVPPYHKRDRAFYCSACGQRLDEPLPEAELLQLRHTTCPVRDKESPDGP